MINKKWMIMQIQRMIFILRINKNYNNIKPKIIYQKNR